MKTTIARVVVLALGVIGTGLAMERNENQDRQVPPKNQKSMYRVAKKMATAEMAAARQQRRQGQNNGALAARRRLDFGNAQLDEPQE